MKKILCLLAFTVIFSSVILADVRLPDTPTPKPKKSIDTNLTIRFDKNTKEAKLIIPKSQIKQLRAELEQLENEQDTNASATTGFTRTQTIVSGMFMSLAFLFGGVWFTRSRKINTKAGKTLVAGAVLFCVGSLATIAFGNAGPPAELRQITSKLFDKKVFGYWNTAGGKIKLETATDDTTNVQLIIPDVKEDKPNKEE
jgi:hypothetical protein